MTETMAAKPATTRVPRQLLESDVHGKGAAEIGWGSPGDFKRCQAFARAHGIPGHMIDGFCANLHRIATGEWPGPNAHKGAHALALDYLIASAAPDGYQRIPWHGPLAPIGVPTGDRRMFPAKTLTYQTFPMPLRWQPQSGPGHSGAITVGVIEHAEERMVDGKPMVYAHGYWLDPKVIPEVTRAMYEVKEGVSGPSVDLDSYTAALGKHASLDQPVAVMRRGRVRAATLVSVPAFADLRLHSGQAGGVVPFVSAPSGPDTANVATVATFAVNSSGWRGAPIAPREALFDADDAAKRIEGWANGDPKKMASMFLWIADSANAPLIGRKGYRLPWGDIIDGKPYLIYHAVYAAAALLEGAHGGLPNIPDEEKGKLRAVVSSIYEDMAAEFDDPSIIAPWDRAAQQAQQASGEVAWTSDDDDEFASYAFSYTAALAEFVRHHRYTEAKHPRDKRKDDHAGEWIDTPHGPHGQIKVGGKWVYPPKRGEKGYQNPEKAARGIAKRGGGKPGGSSGESKRGPGTYVVRKAKPQEERHHAPAPAAKKAAPKIPAKKAAAPQVDQANARRHLESMRDKNRLERADYLKRLKEHEVDNLVRYLGGTKHEDDTRDDTEIEVLHQMEKNGSGKDISKERNKDVERAKAARELDHGGGRKTVIAKKEKAKEAPAKEAPKKTAAKTTVVSKSTGQAKAHKLTGPQQSALERLRDDENAKIHPATKKVLQREDYLDSDGKLTQKGRDHLGTKEVPKKATKTTVAKKTAAPKPAKKTTEDHVKALEGLESREDADKYLADQKLTNAELRDIAKAQGKKPTSGMTKAQLTELVGRGARMKGYQKAVKTTFKQPKVSVKERNEAKRKENLEFLRSTRSEDQVAERLKNMKRSELIATYNDSELNPIGGGHNPKWTDDDLRQAVLRLWQNRQRNISRREVAERERVALAERKVRMADYHERVVEADKEHREAVLRHQTENPLVVTGTSHSDSWTRKIPEDTGPLGIPVKGLVIDASGINGGYRIESGRVIRRNGISYLIEDDPKLMADEMADFLEAIHRDLPGADRVMKGYAWLKGESPDDPYWQERFDNPNHRGAASSGDGIMRFWGPGNQEGLVEQQRRAKHEYGHNVDNMVAAKDGSGSESERWHRRAEKDKDVAFPIGWQWDGIRKSPDKSVGGSDREAPLGVTDYGKSSWAEDYAESLDMYLRGSIGSASQGISKRVPVYFRDLFPNRAELLDELFPDIGRKQREEIGRRGALTFV